MRFQSFTDVALCALCDISSQIKNSDSLLAWVKRPAAKTGRHFPLFFKPDCEQKQTEATCPCVVLVALLL